MTSTEDKNTDVHAATAATDGEAKHAAAEDIARQHQTYDSAEDETQGDDFAGEIARLEAEKADLTDRLVRTVAEMENLRRRTERDVADARRYAVTKFAGDMLTVGDNLRRALEALPADTRSAADEGLKALLDGVEMTARELDRTLAKHGIQVIAAEGERFDPNRHQAMFEIPNADVPNGTVMQVMQAGYTIGDRVLRAAMVGVSRGGPKADAAGGAKDQSAAAQS
ncbi:molecular chaperone GrpE [Faunimonas pinastri]|uniref:Protein GrpE n=1 Tax=Faunimonas pinastri TaxID=1855383 RepID=A0A1H9GZ72_9HYPH|nr:nucleotide exchange factor GrpE [Faunimonas pinastri]SEQ55298.1 molecular chaperone GrpE [Faunimonas pinastri]